MAIQITEKLLSAKAQKALNNAVNKSQFLRDAIEYYVNREPQATASTASIDPDIRNDIQEIKELLQKLTNQPGVTESAASIEKIVVSAVERKAEIAVANKVITERPKDTVTPIEKTVSEPQAKQINSNMSDAEKAAIDKAVADSLLNF